jgi:hypothetical protein
MSSVPRLRAERTITDERRSVEQPYPSYFLTAGTRWLGFRRAGLCTLIQWGYSWAAIFLNTYGVARKNSRAIHKLETTNITTLSTNHIRWPLSQRSPLLKNLSASPANFPFADKSWLIPP